MLKGEGGQAVFGTAAYLGSHFWDLRAAGQLRLPRRPWLPGVENRFPRGQGGPDGSSQGRTAPGADGVELPDCLTNVFGQKKTDQARGILRTQGGVPDCLAACLLGPLPGRLPGSRWVARLALPLPALPAAPGCPAWPACLALALPAWLPGWPGLPPGWLPGCRLARCLAVAACLACWPAWPVAAAARLAARAWLLAPACAWSGRSGYDLPARCIGRLDVL